MRQACSDAACTVCSWQASNVSNRLSHDALRDMQRNAATFVRKVAGGIELRDYDQWVFVATDTTVLITTDDNLPPSEIEFSVLLWLANLADQPIIEEDFA